MTYLLSRPTRGGGGDLEKNRKIFRGRLSGGPPKWIPEWRFSKKWTVDVSGWRRSKRLQKLVWARRVAFIFKAARAQHINI